MDRNPEIYKAIARAINERDDGISVIPEIDESDFRKIKNKYLDKILFKKFREASIYLAGNFIDSIDNIELVTPGRYYKISKSIKSLTKLIDFSYFDFLFDQIEKLSKRVLEESGFNENLDLSGSFYRIFSKEEKIHLMLYNGIASFNKKESKFDLSYGYVLLLNENISGSSFSDIAEKYKTERLGVNPDIVWERKSVKYKDKRTEYIDFVTNLLDVSVESAGRHFDIILGEEFAQAATLVQASAPHKLPDAAPRTATMALPEQAPELYSNKRGGWKDRETIVDFLRRVWKPWIEAGVLTRPDLRRLDPKADRAIVNWMQTKGPLPTDLSIPTKSDIVSQRLENPENIKAAQRVVSAHHYRKTIS